MLLKFFTITSTVHPRRMEPIDTDGIHCDSCCSVLFADIFMGISLIASRRHCL